MNPRRSWIVVITFAAIFAFTQSANAQGVQFLGVGSSAMFNTFAVAAFTDQCSSRVGSDCHHYSIGGKNSSDGQNFAQAVDGRNTAIAAEGGNLWVVWDNSTSPITIWADLSVDSTVGVRCFSAVPRCDLQVDSGVLTTAGQNKVPGGILLNKQTGLTQADESSLPSAVLSAIQTSFTAALTVIRPEDAKFATNRALAVYNAKNLNGLGYGVASSNCPGATTLIGCPILSAWGSGAATPVQFSIKGLDPFTGLKVKPWATIDVGAEPVLFLYNATNASGLGAQNGGVPVLQDITTSKAQQVWNGTQGGATFLNSSLNNVPLSILQLEPLGTALIPEFSTFRTFNPPNFTSPKNSQEAGIDLTQPNTNPLNLATKNGGGVRLRAIATSQIINGNGKGVGGIKNLPDSIGYVSFSLGNVSAVAGPSGVGRYVTLDGVDPINATYSNGVLPTCANPCPAAPGSSFKHVRDGSYRAWTVLRVLTDKVGSPNYTAALALATGAQESVNSTVPDFVPFNATSDGDPGLQYLHSHFPVPGVKVPNNGITGLEVGGDVGGCPFKIGGPNQNVTGVRLNGSLSFGTCDLSPGHD